MNLEKTYVAFLLVATIPYNSEYRFDIMCCKIYSVFNKWIAIDLVSFLTHPDNSDLVVCSPAIENNFILRSL